MIRKEVLPYFILESKNEHTSIAQRKHLKILKSHVMSNIDLVFEHVLSTLPLGCIS